MAYTFTRIARQSLGDKILTVTLLSEAASDGATTVTAKQLQMARIECAWLQDVDDAASITLTTYKGTSIVLSAAIDTGSQLLFAIGV
jgi:hypothetical protein